MPLVKPESKPTTDGGAGLGGGGIGLGGGGGGGGGDEVPGGGGQATDPSTGARAVTYG